MPGPYINDETPPGIDFHATPRNAVIGTLRSDASVQDVADAGVRRAWLPQVFGGEALTLIAVAGREIPDVEFGTPAPTSDPTLQKALEYFAQKKAA